MSDFVISFKSRQVCVKGVSEDTMHSSNVYYDSCQKIGQAQPKFRWVIMWAFSKSKAFHTYGLPIKELVINKPHNKYTMK